MKTLSLTFIALAAATSLSFAQTYWWTDAGLVPRTASIDVNTNGNNNGLETGDISIAANNNVILAWEDDLGGGGPLTDWEAVWTLYDRDGNLLTAPVTISNIVSANCINSQEVLTNTTYLSFFRSDGSPTPGYTSDFGGKAHGNLYGNGLGFGSAGTPACELPELFNIQIDNAGAGAGDIPAVQLLNNDGSRNAGAGGPDIAGILTYSDADCEPAGNIRIADFEFLSNGNIVLAGESRQAADRALTGQSGGNVAVYKVLTAAGAVVHAYAAASSEPVGQGMWHGAASFSNGFALRFGSDTGDKIRFFNNAGNPTTPNIKIAAAACHPEAGNGGRGDGTGFKGNGNDAVVYACNTGVGPWVTVFNANGTVRYSRRVADDNNATGGGSDRLDAAIAADGRVIVIFQAANNDTNNSFLYGLPQARLFDACGGAIGPVFYVSERDNPTNAVASNGGSGRPRVAWRGSQIAAMWGSLNSPTSLANTLTLRVFDAPTMVPCAISSVCPDTLRSDTIVWYDGSVHRQKLGSFVNANAVPNQSSAWEPYAGLLGDSTFLLGTDTYADDNTDTFMRSGLVFQPADGSSGKLGNGFYDDANKPWTNQVNLSRQDGNPNRVAGDLRPGATNFMAGMEASLFHYSDFNSDGRFNLATPFYSTADGNSARLACVQTFSLNTGTLVQTPRSKALDSAFSGLTGSTPAAGNQLSRFGGHIQGLDNGNFVSVVEDRSRLFNAGGNASVATIFAPNGSIVTAAFKVADADQWANVAAFQGGFSVRPSGGSIYFFNNAGALQGSLNHNATSGLTYDNGRGDGTRTASDIRSHYVYMAGVADGNHVWLSVFNAQTRTFVTKAIVDDTDPAVHGLDRVNLAVDAKDRICVVFKVKPDQVNFPLFQTAARVLRFDGANLTYVTASFFPFVNSDFVGDKGIKTAEPSVAMTTSSIFVSAKGIVNSTNNPAGGGDTLDNTDVYTVICNPASEPTMSIAQSGANVVISWDKIFGPRWLCSSPSVSPTSWSGVNPQPAIVTVGNKNTMTVPIGAGPVFFRLTRM